jgi:hypothetical protein
MGSRTWNAHPALGWLVRVAAFLLPVVVAVVGGYVASALLPRPSSTAGIIGWWVLFALALLIPAAICLRLARRFLPLAALLKLTLVFPDRAPSRFEIAKRAGRTRDLKKRLAEQTEEGDATEAAALVLALISSLGEHDRATRGHSERVRAFTDMIGERIGLARPERDKLRWGALLHDVGKLEVAGEVLNKPGRPTDEEWVLLRQHPLDGLRLLGPLVEWLGPWSGAVSDHHERWDGTGYPRGLEGSSISMAGRILAVADSYEVMTAARAYKRPMTAGAARTELTRCAGTHFDPSLVREFLEISVGRLWIAIGLGAFLAQLPVLSGLSYRGLTERFGRSVSTAATALGTAALLAVGGSMGVAIPSRTEYVVATTETPERGAGPEEIAGRAGSERGGSDDDAGGGSPGGEGTSDELPVAVTPVARPVIAAPHPNVKKPTEGNVDGTTRRIVEEGQIAAPAPLDPTVSGVTEAEFLSTCRVPASQGTDAWVIRLPEETVSSLVVAVEPGAGGSGSHVRTYSEDCEPAGRLGFGRANAIPRGAAWVVVVPTQGLATSVTVEIFVRG